MKVYVTLSSLIKISIVNGDWIAINSSMEQNLFQIVRYCDERLRVAEIEDYPEAYNGLQFQNSGKITKIAAAVDASLESIQNAVAMGANLLIAHHGLFWGKPMPIVNNIYEKYKLLVQHDIAVYACHLPLDAHSEIGNNASLAKLLKLSDLESAFEFHGNKVGFIGTRNIQRDLFKQELESHFSHMIAMEFGSKGIQKIGVCSGGSGGIIAMADKLGIDTVIVGECNQYLYNVAREHGINAYLCGHYATETFGVNNLGQELSEHFQLPYIFLPSECPL